MNPEALSYVERRRCPVYCAIHIIEGRWKPMIFRRLGEEPKGFGDLRRSMPGVTSKVLRQHLRQLNADGIIAKVIYEKPVRRVCYKLTPHGRTLGPVFETLWAWGTRHLALASSSQEGNGRCSRQMLG
jgi:DNA-binding HxlR family transcriptional regulator